MRSEGRQFTIAAGWFLCVVPELQVEQLTTHDIPVRRTGHSTAALNAVGQSLAAGKAVQWCVLSIPYLRPSVCGLAHSFHR